MGARDAAGRRWTPVELLTVVAILSVLIALLLPALSAARRTARFAAWAAYSAARSRDARCAAHFDFQSGLDDLVRGRTALPATLPNAAGVREQQGRLTGSEARALPGSVWTWGRGGGVRGSARKAALGLDGAGGLTLRGGFDRIADVTLLVWARSDPGTSPYPRALLSRTANDYRLYVHAGQVVFGVDCLLPTDNLPRVAAPWPDDGAWHSVAGVYDGRHADLYVDGRRAGRALTPPGAVKAPRIDGALGIGCFDDGAVPEYAAFGWRGALDEASVFSEALPETEIAEWHRVGLFDRR